MSSKSPSKKARIPSFKSARKKYQHKTQSHADKADVEHDRSEIESKCVRLFGSKKKCNKFIKQALLKGNQIRTKSNCLRYDYQGYQLWLKHNDLKSNKKLAMKALLHIEYEGDKTAQRMSSSTASNHNKNKEQSASAHSSKYPSLFAADFQYSRNDRILILGEMDFSLALDVAHKIGGANIVATAYYKENKVREKTQQNIQLLRKLHGKQVLFEVDATQLRLPHSMKFDKILFGYPRNSNSPDSQKHNVLFMRRVFEEVKKYLERGGQFHLLMHVNTSGHSPLEQWKMSYADWRCVHEQLFTPQEMKKMFALYQSHDGKNNVWIPHRTALYVFELQPQI